MQAWMEYEGVPKEYNIESHPAEGTVYLDTGMGNDDITVKNAKLTINSNSIIVSGFIKDNSRPNAGFKEQTYTLYPTYELAKDAIDRRLRKT